MRVQYGNRREVPSVLEVFGAQQWWCWQRRGLLPRQAGQEEPPLTTSSASTHAAHDKDAITTGWRQVADCETARGFVAAASTPQSMGNNNGNHWLTGQSFIILPIYPLVGGV